ncbi:MAG: hypothetical protein SGJ20_20595 [Planctomycetota bacterium]|nr:hypothetical protein [Planctomycetota bacterium]
MSELRYEISYGLDDSALTAWLIDCQTKLPSFRASIVGSAPENKGDGTYVRQVLIVSSLPENEAAQEVEAWLQRNGLTFNRL